MVVSRHAGMEWSLEWNHEAGLASPIHAGARLRDIRRDAATWSNVRSLMSRRMNVSRLSDDELQEMIAGMLASGALQLHWRSYRLVAPEIRATAAPAEAPPAPAPAREVEPEPEPEGFPPEHDAVAQAETLRSAARNGAPFCEECERAQQGGEAETRPTTPVYARSSAAPRPAAAPVIAPAAEEDPERFPEDHDPVRQAGALRSAAANGTALCEECSRKEAA